MMLQKLSTDKLLKYDGWSWSWSEFPPKNNVIEKILEVKNLTALYQPSINDVSFDLHKEIWT